MDESINKMLLNVISSLLEDKEGVMFKYNNNECVAVKTKNTMNFLLFDKMIFSSSIMFKERSHFLIE